MDFYVHIIAYHFSIIFHIIYDVIIFHIISYVDSWRKWAGRVLGGDFSYNRLIIIIQMDN